MYHGWGKLLMAGAVLIGAVLALAHWGVAQERTGSAVDAGAKPGQGGAPWVESYVDSAEVAALYGSAEDAITPAEAGQLLLELTNGARADAGLPSLAWRDDAALLGQAHSDDMVARHYISHYDLTGRKCELRYNDAGGKDQVSENTAYYEIHHDIYLTPQLVKRMHQHWLDSESHRLNIMEAEHTHLGAGFAVVSHEGVSYVAGTVEFINDYGDYERLPANARAGETLRVAGQLDPARARLAYIGVGSEDLPKARTVEYQMSHIGGYSPPLPALYLLPATDALVKPPERWRYMRPTVQFDATTGRFAAEVNLRANWPAAAYYVTVWAVPPSAVQRDGSPDYTRAFCTMTQVVLVKPGSTFR